MTEAAAHLFSASEWAEWLADAERRQREVYRLSPERLIAEYRREREITRGYHGREILELLQNAGDAARLSDTSGRIRFIEVKGRSSSTAKIELKGNELRAARRCGDRYFLYRFYEATDGQFFVSILQNPMNAGEAKATIIAVDLDRAKGTQRYEFVVEAAMSVSNDDDPESAPVHSLACGR